MSGEGEEGTQLAPLGSVEVAGQGGRVLLARFADVRAADGEPGQGTDPFGLVCGDPSEPQRQWGWTGERHLDDAGMLGQADLW